MSLRKIGQKTGETRFFLGEGDWKQPRLCGMFLKYMKSVIMAVFSTVSSIFDKGH